MTLYSNLSETNIPTNKKLIIPLHPVVSSVEISSTPMLTPPSSYYSPENDKKKSDDNNVQVQYKLLDEGSFPDAFDQNTSDITLVDSIFNEYLSQQNSPSSQLYQNIATSTNLHRKVTSNYNVVNNFLLFEELMDFLPSTADNIVATYRHADENIDTINPSTVLSYTHTITGSKRNHVRKERSLKQTTNNRKTLFVSGLQSHANANDIYRHFIGGIRVTIKQYRTTPHLKYAFVVHRTFEEATRNLRRRINFHLLGPKCRVEYAHDCSSLSTNHQNFGNRKLMVARIPENVSEDDLHHLFVNCHILKYCPARTVHRATRTMEMKDKSKIIWGYAFIVYDNEEQAASVLKHNGQYHINDHPLVVSLYRDTNQQLQ